MGNPHSSSPASQFSTRRVEDVRLKALRFFKADPEYFDLVFVANATAGIKLVMEAFRDNKGGFWYGYHADSHTSLVGVREVASLGSACFQTDQEVEEWLCNKADPPSSRFKQAGETKAVGLFAYPAQSNMNGRRLSLLWPGLLRSSSHRRHSDVFSLLDAAAFVSTSQLDLSDPCTAPDFIALSFYKMFGFPDLGALIVRKQSSWPLMSRKYFGGGTVQTVSCMKEQWHVKKDDSVHEFLEDGSAPIHSIIALDCAFRVYNKLFGSINFVSSHTCVLSQELYKQLSSLRHRNGQRMCRIYKSSSSNYGDSLTQGPVLALNLQDHKGTYVSNSEFEKLASIRNVHIRVGALCNPGGIEAALGLAPWELKRNFSAGYRCGLENDIMGGKPTGVIRISLGAMSDSKDIEAFVELVKGYFVEDRGLGQLSPRVSPTFYIERLTIYPIKSCGLYEILSDWDVHDQGLAFDREWCIVRQGSRKALSQKDFPRMTLIKPKIDLENGVLNVTHHESKICIPLSADPRQYKPHDQSRARAGSTALQIYASFEITEFFTTALGTPCALGRYPSSGSPTRHSKPHLDPPPRDRGLPESGAHPPPQAPQPPRPTHLSNESPILTISHSSLNLLNEQIKSTAGKATPAAVFRANILLAETSTSPSTEHPYAEDQWRYMRVGAPPSPSSSSPSSSSPSSPALYFKFLGGCRRCEMVCIDPAEGVRDPEPLATLARTRRVGGRVLFGLHTVLLGGGGSGGGSGGRGGGWWRGGGWSGGGRGGGRGARIRVGDLVVPFREEVGGDERLGGLLLSGKYGE